MSWYDLQGVPFDLIKQPEVYEKCVKNKIIAQTTLPGGKWISTVWVGLSHGLDNKGLPLIFETMVFTSPQSHFNYDNLDCKRYATLEEAKNGHATMYQKWWAKWLEDPDLDYPDEENTKAKEILFKALKKAEVNGSIKVLNLLGDIIFALTDVVVDDNTLKDFDEVRVLLADLLNIDHKDLNKPISKEAIESFEGEKEEVYKRLKAMGVLK